MADSLLEGRATAEGTARWSARFPGRAFRCVRGLTFSTLGLGTYLGPATQDGDRRMAESVRRCLRAGVNVFDTAINYRHQRSERVLGDALERALLSEEIRRDEVVVATKGGFLPFDGDVPASPREYLESEYLASGLLKPADVAAGCHAMAPAYLRDQVRRSLRNLKLSTVDAYFLHNPETQAAEFPPEVVRERFLDAFEALEREVEAGRIASYGVATWSGLRVPPDHPEHLSLSELLGHAAAARERVGPGDPHFTTVELPVNLAMVEAAGQPTQSWNGKRVPLLQAAREAGLVVFASAPLLQGRLAKGLPARVREAFRGRTDAEDALQFARSLPGVATALAGMLTAVHAEENLALLETPPDPEAALGLLEG